MNKKNILMLIAIVLLVGYGSFTLGYKKGSAKGIQVGMAYNCQEDLNTLKKVAKKISDEVEKKLVAVENKNDPHNAAFAKVYDKRIPWYCINEKLVYNDDLKNSDLSQTEKRQFIENYKKSIEYINKRGWQQDVIMHEVNKSCEDRERLALEAKKNNARLDSLEKVDHSQMTETQRKEVELHSKQKAFNASIDQVLKNVAGQK